MAYHQTAPAAMPAHAQPSQNAAQTQRINQVQFLEERLRNGISPAAVAGITALSAQLETQRVKTLLKHSESIKCSSLRRGCAMAFRRRLWQESLLFQRS